MLGSRLRSRVVWRRLRLRRTVVVGFVAKACDSEPRQHLLSGDRNPTGLAVLGRILG